MSKHRNLPHFSMLAGFLILTASAIAGQTGQTNIAKPGEQVERHLSGDQTFKEWSLDPSTNDAIKRIKVCRVETLCKMRFKEGQTPRMRVRNLVSPLRYEDDATPIPESFTRQIRQAFDNLREKQGVKVRFIGYTDDAKLNDLDQSTFGDHLSLSKARAHRVALTVQETLGLPASAIESDGRGASHPLASNATAQGQTLNRRIEDEFWYDTSKGVPGTLWVRTGRSATDPTDTGQWTEVAPLATSVAYGTSYGQEPRAGTLNTYAHEDHQHGTPPPEVHVGDTDPYTYAVPMTVDLWYDTSV